MAGNNFFLPLQSKTAIKAMLSKKQNKDKLTSFYISDYINI